MSDDNTEMAIISADLAHHDTPYLRTATNVTPLEPTPQPMGREMFIEVLARHAEPRVREALIPLFLRHPEYHRYVPDLAMGLDAQAALTLRHFYTAAVYLQHLWRSSLGLVLGVFPSLPDYYGETEFGLPSPQIHWGEAGLRLLAARFEAKTGDNWLSTYESALSRFLAQQQLTSDQNSDD